jgi:hypothetical protein
MYKNSKHLFSVFYDRMNLVRKMSREVVKVGVASDIQPSLDPFLYFRYRPRTTDFKGFTDHPHRYGFFEIPFIFFLSFYDVFSNF